MTKLLLTCSCSIMALTSAPVLAQSTTSAPVSGAATPADTSTPGVEEIIVTAQRRNERQQDVPISITTVTAAAAERQGAVGTESIGLAVPAIQFSRQTGNGGAPFVRGVGSEVANAGTESPIAVYVDDVYIGAPSGTIFQFNNIDSVEVLKGPQGTLFGRNASGGVVNVRTKAPSEKPALDATVGYGSYQTVWGNLYATTGLTDNLALNFSATGQKQSKGYGYNIITGADTLKSWNYGFRSQLLWKPDSLTSVLLSGDYSRYDGDVGMSVFIAPGTVGNGGGKFVNGYGTYDSGDSAPSLNYGVSGKVTHNFGPFRLVSISAYRYSAFCLNLDVDGSPGLPVQYIGCVKPPYGSITKTFSQELQLQSATIGPFTWILGGFYYKGDVKNQNSFTSGTAVKNGFVLNAPSAQNLNSFAAFGDATYEFLPGTRITAGLRYTDDRRDRIIPAPTTSNFAKVTYRAILDHKFAPDVMAYASYSRGFKSGGFNNPITAANGVVTLPPAIAPETLDAYEIGLKSEFFGHTLLINPSIFHYEYKNLQVSQIIAGNNLILNAANARINGADIDWQFAPTRAFSFGGGFAFLDSKFKDFPSGPLFVPRPATCTPTPTTTGPLTGGNLTCPFDLSGNRTPRSPKFTMSLTATYTLVTAAGNFTLNGSLYHNSGFFWEPDNRTTQPKYNLLNASLAWTNPAKRLEVKAFVKNITNQYYLTYESEGGLRDAGSPAMPRNYGVSLGVHF